MTTPISDPGPGPVDRRCTVCGHTDRIHVTHGGGLPGRPVPVLLDRCAEHPRTA